MKHRKLRIAWSVVWGVVTVLLCVLWVRSYEWADTVKIGSANCDFESDYGFLGINVYSDDLSRSKVPPWEHGGGGNNLEEYSHWAPIYERDSSSTLLLLPNWIVGLMLVMLGALPWIPWSTRFSLRTLLIATTLIAVGLWLIVWSSGS